MNKISDTERFAILQLASGHHTTSNLPDNWYNMEDTEQNQWLDDHVIEAHEYLGADAVWNLIEASADVTITHIEKTHLNPAMTLLVNIRAQIGEYQKNISTLVRDAPNEKEAGLYAMAVECHGGVSIDLGSVFDCSGEMAYKVDGYKEVDARDAVTLAQYMSVYQYDAVYITEVLGENCRAELEK